MKQNQSVPIAIVGMNALYPGSVDKHGFWHNILEGNDLITDIPESHFLIDDYYDPEPGNQDKIYVKRGGFLPDVEFDPMEFGITPSSIPATDTSQLLGLMVAKQVLEEAAGSQFKTMDRDKISVILGVASTTDLVVDLAARIQRPVWVKALRESGLPEDQVQAICDRIASNYTPWQEASFPGLLGNVVAGRIANRLNLGGSNLVTDAACASSLSAMAMSIMELATYKSDLVISGGVDTLSSIFMHMCFTKTPALSKTNDCRPFSDHADGTLLGEGVGMVALKRLDDAERDNDRIYAVIRGYGSSSDGNEKAVYAPNAKGQAKALRRAYDMAGYSPDTVELVEAHGTGTKAGDIAEFEGLRTVFEETERQETNWCALGSIKSQIGHTKAAAGAASLFKVVMALHHKVLPPTIKADKPNPNLHIENSPFYLNTEARPWIRHSNHPRRASLSSFGFGGSNFHMTVEEYTGDGNKAFRVRRSPSQLITLTEDNISSLVKSINSLIGNIDNNDYNQLEHIARFTQERYQSKKKARLAIVAIDFKDLKQKLYSIKDYLQDGETHLSNNGIYLQLDSSNKRVAPKVAFLFPGQGSQYLGMTKDITMAFDEAREVWDQTTQLTFDNKAVHNVVFPIPTYSNEQKHTQLKQLTATEWAQPALGLASLSLFSIMKRIGVQPDCVAGHSYGEIPALHVAGVFDEMTMVNMSRKRGELMCDTSENTGVMTAVFHEPKYIEKEIEAVGGLLNIANYNSNDQCVVSGERNAMDTLEKRLNSNGISYRRLPVANAFHSPFVSDSVRPFKQFLENFHFNKPNIPVYSNYDGQPFSQNPDAIKERLAEQIASPVQFRQQISNMVKDGVSLFVECGPSSVLSGLVPKCTEKSNIQIVSMDRKGSHGLNTLWHAIGQLVASGVHMNLSTLWVDIEPAPKANQSSKKKMKLIINGANYGKPYPPQEGSHALPKPNISKKEEVQDNNESHQLFNQTNGLDNQNNEGIDGKPYGAASLSSDSNEQGGNKMNTNNYSKSQRGASTQNNIHQQRSVEPTLSNVPGYIQIQKQVIDTHSKYLQLISESHAQFLRTAASHLESSEHYPTDMIPEYSFNQVDNESIEWHSDPIGSHNEPVWEDRTETSVDNQYDQVEMSRINEQIMNANKEIATTKVDDVNEVQLDTHNSDAPKQEDNHSEVSVKEILLNIVSEKTGYPADMLDREVDIESGLGIDSIKRVEIFAALQEEIPGLPEIEPGQLAALNTLAEIEEFVDQKIGKKKLD